MRFGKWDYGIWAWETCTLGFVGKGNLGKWVLGNGILRKWDFEKMGFLENGNLWPTNQFQAILEQIEESNIIFSHLQAI